jgi:acetyl-CoA acyltransferase
MARTKNEHADTDPVIIDGVRTPFLRSNGAYSPLMGHDLGRHAVAGLLARTGLDPEEVDQVAMGTVIADTRTPNVAREIALGAGIPTKTPAYTTTLACVSANLAATSVGDMIQLGRVGVAIVGGTETFSDPPIRLSKNLRQGLALMQKAKGPKDYLKILSRLSPMDLAPDIPSPAEYSTGLTMGQSCERMTLRFGVTREESDAFAVFSHQNAVNAWDAGRCDDVIPVRVPPKMKGVEKDNGPRGDTSADTLKKLRPVFDRQFGVVTAGSSSFLTDGATAVLLTSRQRATELGFVPKTVIKDYVYKGCDLKDELLIGPALSIPALLYRHGLGVEDIDVWEIHEAFASQVVANLKALADDTFCKERTPLSGAFGEIPMEKLNQWGGSLSIGHPFGATGGRLLTTASRRLEEEGGRFAVVAGCAAGGHGSAILLENASA